jgi:ParB family chromosome partitioning protein
VKKGLGKSLDEIISAGVKRPMPAVVATPPQGLLVRMIGLEYLRANRRQPRRQFDEKGLEELAASIREHGVLQPVTVRQQPDGTFELIAGERRWRAAQLAGLSQIPAQVRTTDDAGSLELALVENLQREDLNPLEEAYGYEQLAAQFDMTQEQIASKVGKDRATIANALRLLQLSPKLHHYLVHRQLSAGHAKSLLAIGVEELQIKAAEAVIRDGLSVRATEQLVRALTAGRRPRGGRGAVAQTSPHMKAVEDALQHKLSTRVRVISKGEKGRIEIDYFSREDLDRLLAQFGVSL